MAYIVARNGCCHCKACWDVADVPHGTLGVVFTVREKDDDGFELHVIQGGFATKAAADEVRRAIERCGKIASNIRHPKARRPAATTPRPNCLACNKPLQRYSRDGRTFDDGTPQEWGNYGDNRFCGLTCGWRWACRHAPMPATMKGAK